MSSEKTGKLEKPQYKPSLSDELIDKMEANDVEKHILRAISSFKNDLDWQTARITEFHDQRRDLDKRVLSLEAWRIEEMKRQQDSHAVNAWLNQKWTKISAVILFILSLASYIVKIIK